MYQVPAVVYAVHCPNVPGNFARKVLHHVGGLICVRSKCSFKTHSCFSYVWLSAGAVANIRWLARCTLLAGFKNMTNKCSVYAEPYMIGEMHRR